MGSFTPKKRGGGKSFSHAERGARKVVIPLYVLGKDNHISCNIKL